jgi:hypothetical protein
MDTVFVFGADTGGGAARLTPEKLAEATVENHKMDTKWSGGPVTGCRSFAEPSVRYTLANH